MSSLVELCGLVSVVMLDVTGGPSNNLHSSHQILAPELGWGDGAEREDDREGFVNVQQLVEFTLYR